MVPGLEGNIKKHLTLARQAMVENRKAIRLFQHVFARQAFYMPSKGHRLRKKAVAKRLLPFKSLLFVKTFHRLGSCVIGTIDCVIALVQGIAPIGFFTIRVQLFCLFQNLHRLFV